MDVMSTEELIRRVEKMEADEAERQKRRHSANNTIGKSLLRMGEDITRLEAGALGIPALADRVIALDHLIRGVDGNNGIRGDVKAIKASQETMKENQANMKTNVAVLSAGFAMGGTLAMQWILALFKG
jgi:hypothetical protein